jgi:WD40 repeat protein
MIRLPHAALRRIRVLACDGQSRILSSDGGEVRCWPADAGAPGGPDVSDRTDGPRMRCTEWLPGLGALALAELPDGSRIVVAASRTTLWRWNAATGLPFGDPITHRSSFRTSLVVSSGTVIVTGVARGGMRRYDARTGEALGEPFGVDSGDVWALASTTLPDGTPVVLSGGPDRLIHRWDPRTGTETGEPLDRCGWAVAIAIASSVVCVLSARGKVHRRDLITGERIGEPIDTGWQPPVFGGKQRKIACPGTLTAVATSDGEGVIATRPDYRFPIQRWDMRAGTTLESLPTSDWLLAAAHLADGTPVIVTGGRDGVVRRFDAGTGKPAGEPMYPHGHRAYTATRIAMPDGRLVVAAMGGQGTSFFDARTGDRVGSWRAGSYFLAAATVPDGRVIVVAAGNGEGIERMDLVSGTTYPPANAEKPREIWCVAMATLPGGRVIIAGSGNSSLVYRWDAATGEQIGEPLTGHLICVTAVTTARQANGAPMFITGCERGELLRWDAATGEQIGPRVFTDEHGIHDLSSLDLPGGRQLLVGTAGDYLHRWDPVTGKPEPLLRIGEPARIITAYLDDAGIPMVLISTDEKEEQLWRLDTGERAAETPAGLRGVFHEDDGTTWTVTAEADGGLLITQTTPPA